MDYIQKNIKLVIVVLLVVGVVAAVLTGGNDNNDETQATDTTTTSETSTTDDSKAVTTDVTNGDETASTATKSVVNKAEDTYTIVAVKDDNQTVNVRKVMQNFIKDTGETVSAEQSLFIETTLVDTLPRNDLIYAGNTIVLDGTQIQTVFEAAHQLTDFQISLWAQYL